MSATTFKVSPEYFTPERTQEFLLEHEAACLKMEVVDFLKIFIKYDLSLIEDYYEVINAIIDILSGWKNEKLNTRLLEINSYDSNCLFCEIGKRVKVYQWTYMEILGNSVCSGIVYERKVGFRFEIKEGRLNEYGICNAYV
jgi:hypothetical protein